MGENFFKGVKKNPFNRFGLIFKLLGCDCYNGMGQSANRGLLISVLGAALLGSTTGSSTGYSGAFGTT